MGVADDLTKNGEFIRKDSLFRNFVKKGDGEFPPEKNRYHLYISLACPWAHRTLIVRKLKGLEDVVGLSVVHYLMLENGWEFTDGPGCIPDTVNNFKFIRELYFQSDPSYSGRFTVPVLYDTKTKKIVNNESSEIVRMFNSEFNEFSKSPELDLYPEALRSQIDSWNDVIYHGINNGVYKAGFALTQEAYEPNAKLVYETMLKVEDLVAKGPGPFLFGEALTETDIRLFTSLIRHDPVYYFHFKCNLTAVKDLPNLSLWLKRMYEHGEIKETVNMEHIKKHYFSSHLQINPTGVVPLYNGPIIGN
ncbi:glutathione S-transferase omega-like 2 [Folsomia candida]|uniref:Glutathione S-transferase omega-like 2 n=1 Tax=Folsomia candida TaxID=158441 RepID=A0A226ETF9_FOLCA|nr:glutathione S-transferase omega-like 2 [Folsomia candida]OXA60510.1 Glutathione S-transferase omega-like 2 [Folsomia candida]